jgi:hypothetical protein
VSSLWWLNRAVCGLGLDITRGVSSSRGRPRYSHPIDRQTALVTLETLAYELQAVANATQRQVMWSDLDLALTRAIKRLLEVPAR